MSLEHPFWQKNQQINSCGLNDTYHILQATGTQAAARTRGHTLWLNRYLPSSCSTYWEKESMDLELMCNIHPLIMGGNFSDLSTWARLLSSHREYLFSIKTQNIPFCIDLLQISESWAALRETAQYYMDLDPYAFDPSTAVFDGVSQQSIS